ncbi:hypothetical protein HYX13_00310 [Candidatus Woesearchaeota archaeon]|nr:hypothetical protein [Candidatus Woesearchaeota archaeon]
MEYKSRYLRETPGAIEALERIAEEGAQETREEITAFYQKNNTWYKRGMHIAKNNALASGIGAVLGYLGTGNAEGAQQGALTGATASAFGMVVLGIPFYYGFKKLVDFTIKNNAYSPKMYKKNADNLLADQEEKPTKERVLTSAKNTVMSAGFNGSLYAFSSGAVDVLFGTNFSSWTAAEIGGLLGAYTALRGDFSKEKEKEKRVEKVKRKIEDATLLH